MVKVHSSILQSVTRHQGGVLYFGAGPKHPTDILFFYRQWSLLLCCNPRRNAMPASSGCKPRDQPSVREVYTHDATDPCAARLSAPLSHLDQAIKVLLACPRTLLHPRLFLPAAKELRRLKDADGGVHQVRKGLSQEVRSRAEVGVEDDDNFARRPREGVAEISRLLQLGAVVPPNVWLACRARQGCYSTQMLKKAPLPKVPP